MKRHHLMGMSREQILARLEWLERHRHFPGAGEDIAFLHTELALRFA